MRKGILLACCLFSINSAIASDNSDKKNTFRHYAEKGLQFTGAVISATVGVALCKGEWNRWRTAGIASKAAAAPHIDKAYVHLGNWYKKAYPNVVTSKNIDFKELTSSSEGQRFLSNAVNTMSQTEPNNPYFAEMNAAGTAARTAAGKYDHEYRPVAIVFLAAIPISIACYLFYKCFFAAKKKPEVIDE